MNEPSTLPLMSLDQLKKLDWNFQLTNCIPYSPSVEDSRWAGDVEATVYGPDATLRVFINWLGSPPRVEMQDFYITGFEYNESTCGTLADWFEGLTEWRHLVNEAIERKSKADLPLATQITMQPKSEDKTPTLDLPALKSCVWEFDYRITGRATKEKVWNLNLPLWVEGQTEATATLASATRLSVTFCWKAVWAADAYVFRVRPEKAVVYRGFRLPEAAHGADLAALFSADITDWKRQIENAVEDTTPANEPTPLPLLDQLKTRQGEAEANRLAALNAIKEADKAADYWALQVNACRELIKGIEHPYKG